MLPSEVAEAVRGLPQHGRREQAIPLLTRDAEGWPHVCLLSRAQLDEAEGSVLAVITSSQTSRNLVERPQATLVVVCPTVAYYAKLSVVSSVDDGWALGVVLSVASVKADAAPMGLSPIEYVPTPEIEAYENWDRCREFLERLARSVA